MTFGDLTVDLDGPPPADPSRGTDSLALLPGPRRRASDSSSERDLGAGRAGGPSIGRRHRRWTHRGIAAVLVLGDLAAAAVPTLLLGADVAWALAGTVVTVLLFAGARLYRTRLQWSTLDDLPVLVTQRAAALTAVTLALEFADHWVDLSEAATAAVLSTGVMVIVRELAFAAIRAARRHGLVTTTTVIVGGGGVAADLAGVLQRHEDLGLRAVAYVDDRPSTAMDRIGLAWLGGVDDLDRAVAATQATAVLVAFSTARDQLVTESLRDGTPARCELYVVPRLFEITSLRGVQDHIGAIPVVKLERFQPTGFRPASKRYFDVVFSVFAALVLLPVLLGCAVAVRATGRGILFRQQRVGKDGRLFDLYKFRSMRPAAESQTSTTWAARRDPRVTAVGRVLRRTSLDELPQLWNVIRGDMTIVGPRPERPFFVEQFSRDIPHYAHRHRIRAGLTGMAQVSGLRGEDSSIDLRARYDNYYIETWSLWGDVKVIVRTVREVLRGSGG